MSLNSPARIDPRLSLAIGSAHAVSSLSRRFGLGGGTAAPGRVASTMDPRALEKLSGRFSQGAVVVAGTNGKTTTARLLAEILTADGRRVVHNRAGANLVGGIVSTLAAASRVSARGDAGIAVLETDEAALPEVLSRTRPGLVVLTNLFRDQLDRYGEVDSVLGRWRAALAELSDETTVLANGDDPSLVMLTDSLKATRVLFGIKDSRHRLDAVPHAAEVIGCPDCGEPFTYSEIYVGHLGSWRCEACGISRPPLGFAASAVELWSQDFQTMNLAGRDEEFRVEVGLPGLYNSYNVVAAAAAAQTLHISSSVVQRSIAHYRGAFGRSERIVHQGRSLMVMLIKNPVGCNEVLRTIWGVGRGARDPVLFVLNDEASDGRDVSWIWDVDLEQAASEDVDFCAAGTRAADMCNRLYYAGVPRDRIHHLGPDLGKAFDAFTLRIPEGGSGFILPTYSAMLALRQAVGRRRELTSFWAQ